MLMGRAQAYLVLFVAALSQGMALAPKEGESKESEPLFKKYLMRDGKKEGILIGSYIGDHYLSVRDGRLVPTERYQNATFFTVSLKGKDNPKKKGLRLEPYIDKKRLVVTYPVMGDSIMVDNTPNTPDYKLDRTIFKEIVSFSSKNPVYEIRSQHRRLCITYNSSARDYALKKCAHGGDELQGFRFISYNEAVALDGRRNNLGTFSLRSFLMMKYPKSGVALIGDHSGKIYQG